MAKHNNVQLAKIQNLVRREKYDVSKHVWDKIQDGEVDLDDIECSVRNGSIRVTQKDELEQSKDGKKYVILGLSVGGLPFETVGKIMESDDGEEYIFITAYRRI